MFVKSLAHVCLKSSDLEKTTAFYCVALGMSKLFTFTRRGEVIGFYMKANNRTFIEVFKSDEIEKLGKQVLNHFCLEVEDIEVLRTTLIEKGYAPGNIKTGSDKSFQFWMNDPEGLAIEFQQYTKESSQLTGQDVEVNW